jgi:hypothetical protein
LSVTPDQQQWHWGEGNKYAMEAMKALLLLNGGGALALLTFFGNRGKTTGAVPADAIGNALLLFGIGIVGSVLAFLVAYLTQLQYGNSGTESKPVGRWWHFVTYIFVVLGLSGFVVGIYFAKQAVVSALT